MLNPPQISPPGGALEYVSPLRAHIAAPEPDADVWYTIDGSEPVQGAPSLKSSGSLQLRGQGERVVKAKAFADGYLPSETVTATFNLFEDEFGEMTQLNPDQLSASATSSHPDHPPGKAIDSIFDIPGWRAQAEGSGEWLWIDFGFERLIGKVDFSAASAASADTNIIGEYRIYITSQNVPFPPEWGPPVAVRNWSFPTFVITRSVEFAPKRGRYMAIERIGASGFHSASEVAAYQFGIGWVHEPMISLPSGSYPEPALIQLSSTTPESEIWFTLDGSEPVQGGASSTKYISEISLQPGDYTLKARTYYPEYEPSGIVGATYSVSALAEYEEVDKTLITADASSFVVGSEPSKAIDGNTDSGWHSAEDSSSEWLRLDFGEGVERSIGRVSYLARQDGEPDGVFTRYRIYVTSESSQDPADWGQPVAQGDWFWPTFEVPKFVDFSPKTGRYVIFERAQAYLGWATAAEVSVYEASPVPALAPPQSIPSGGATEYASPVRIRLGHPQPEAEIWYTTDGSEPVRGEPSLRATEDIRLEGSGQQTLKAKAFADGSEPSETLTATFNLFEVTPGTKVQLAQDQLTADASSYDPDFPPEKAVNGIVEIPGWRAAGAGGTEWVRIDLGFERLVKEVHHLASGMTGFPATFRFYVTSDASSSSANWGLPVIETEWAFPEEGDTLMVNFTPKRGRYVIIERFNAMLGWASASEVYVFITEQDTEEPGGEEPEELVEVDKTLMTADSSSFLIGWEPAKAIDENINNGGWHCAEDRRFSGSEWLRLDFGESVARRIGRVTYLSRQDGFDHGTFTHYRIYVTTDSSTEVANWGAPVAEGEWTWNEFSSAKVVDFEPKLGRYVIFERLQARRGWASAAEVSVYETISTVTFPPRAFPPAGSYLAPVRVSLTTPANPDAEIWYSLDGSEPEQGSATSTKYTGEIDLPVGSHILKARALDPNLEPSSVFSAEYTAREPAVDGQEQVEKVLMTADASSFVAGGDPHFAIDDDFTTTAWISTHEDVHRWLRLDFGAGIEREIGRVVYRRRSPIETGNTYHYRIFVTSDSSSEPSNWGPPVAEGEWAWPVDQSEQSVEFIPRAGRFVIFQSIVSLGNGVAVGDLSVFQPGADIKARTPEFSTSGGSHVGPLRIRLTSATCGAEIWYTTDGSEPVDDAPSLRYDGELRLTDPGSYLVKAKAFGAGMAPSDTQAAEFTLTAPEPGSLHELHFSQFDATASSFSIGLPARNAIDGNLSSSGWLSGAPLPPAVWLRLDMGEDIERSIGRFKYRRPPHNSASILSYRVFITSDPSDSPSKWGPPVAEGEWNWSGNDLEQTVDFVPKAGRFIILQSMSSIATPGAEEVWAYVAGEGVLPPASPATIQPTPGSYPSPLDVTIETSSSGAEIWYTLDGSEPIRGEPAIRYGDLPFTLSGFGTRTVKAKVFGDLLAPSETSQVTFDLLDPATIPTVVDKTRITATASSSALGWSPFAAIDGNPSTSWHSAVENQNTPSEWIRLDFGAGVERNITKLHYLPRQDGHPHGTFTHYRVFITSSDSIDPGQWGASVSEGELLWENLPEKQIAFTPKAGRFVIFERVAALEGWASAGELTVYELGAMLDAPTLTIIPGEGSHQLPLTVRITSTGPTGEIWYTLNGSEPLPDSRSLRYSGEFVLTQVGPYQIKARNFVEGMNPSPAATAILNIVPPVAPPPEISPGEGEYESPVTVRITSTEGEIWYTLDGTEPQSQAPSLKYTTEFDLTTLGTYLIKARTFVPGKEPSPVRNVSIQIIPENVMQLSPVPGSALLADASTSALGWEAGRAIDGLLSTAWHSAVDTKESSSEWIRLAFRDGLEHQVARISYNPRRDRSPHGTLTHFRVFVTSSASTDPAEWGSPVADGHWTWPQLNVVKTVDFAMKRGRYVILQCVDSLEGWASASEIGVFEFPDLSPRANPPEASRPSGTYVSPVRLTLTTTTPGGEIWYTTDGSDPVQGAPSFEFDGEVELVGSGPVLIKARTFAPDLEPSALSTFLYSLEELSPGVLREVPKNTITATASSFAAGWEPRRAIDGRPGFAWHCAVDRQSGTEEWLRLDFGSGIDRIISRLKYHPRTDHPHGTFTRYRVFVTSQVSDSPAEWGAPVAEGEWTWDIRAEKLIDFTPTRGRFLIIQCLAAQEGWASAGEISVFETDEEALGSASPPTVSLPGGDYVSPVALRLESGTLGAAIWYTLDGTEPIAGEPSLQYQEPFQITGDGSITLKAKAFAEGLDASGTTTVTYQLTSPVPGSFVEITKSLIKADASSYAPGWEPAKAIDGTPAAWHSAVANQHTQEWLRLDFGVGMERLVGQLKYRGRDDTHPHGTFTSFEIYVTSNPSTNLEDWGAPVFEGEWTWEQIPDDRIVNFTPTAGRFVIIRCTSALMGWASAGEVTVYATGSP